MSEDNMSDDTTRHVRTLFISDVHLGTKGAKADMLLDFLRAHDADKIFLVGDIIDGWKLKNGWYFPQSHNDVVQKLLHKARKGARIIYIPGNYDEFLRDFLSLTFGGVKLREDFIHESADCKKYLVIYGDYFDIVVKHVKWLAFLGDSKYLFALASNTYLNITRRKLGFTYWSLSAWAKLKVKNAVNFIGRLEENLAAEAKRLKVDGVICSHIHRAANKDINGVKYFNTSGWVESCTALIEHHDGTMEIIRWAETVALLNTEMVLKNKAA